MLQQDDVPPAPTGVAPEGPLDPDPPKPDGFMEPEAGGVLGHDAGEQRPEARLLATAGMTASSSARPTPRPRASAATYTLSHATPLYTRRDEYAVSATQPRTGEPADSRATSRQSGRWDRSKWSQSGASRSSVASPVAMPSA